MSVCIGTIRPATLASAIASVRRQTWSDWELIVVGQGDEEALRAVTESAARNDSRVRYVHLRRSGLSVARNAGLREAGGDVVAFLDDDCEARADWLATIAECFSEHPDAGVVGGSLLAAPGRWRDLSSCLVLVPGEVVYDPGLSGPPPPAGFEWYGGNVGIRRAVAERIGPFDEFLGPGATFLCADDVDYKLRLEAAGVKMVSTPRSVVFHTHGRRYGVKAVVRYWHVQDTGAGAVAAKLTLRGDRRGEEWRRSKIREYTAGTFRQPRPHRLVAHPVRLQAFLRAYRRCLRDFRLDERGLLTPVAHEHATEPSTPLDPSAPTSAARAPRERARRSRA
jgi:glycosyltransferase involved in cell wall biosynthesis